MPYFLPNMVGPDQLAAASRSAPQYPTEAAPPPADPYAVALQNALGEDYDPDWASGLTPAQIDHMGEINFHKGMLGLAAAGAALAGPGGIATAYPSFADWATLNGLNGLLAVPAGYAGMYAFHRAQDVNRRRFYGDDGDTSSPAYNPAPNRGIINRYPQPSADYYERQNSTLRELENQARDAGNVWFPPPGYVPDPEFNHLLELYPLARRRGNSFGDRVKDTDELLFEAGNI